MGGGRSAKRSGTRLRGFFFCFFGALATLSAGFQPEFRLLKNDFLQRSHTYLKNKCAGSVFRFYKLIVAGAPVLGGYIILIFHHRTNSVGLYLPVYLHRHRVTPAGLLCPIRVAAHLQWRQASHST